MLECFGPSVLAPVRPALKAKPKAAIASVIRAAVGTRASQLLAVRTIAMNQFGTMRVFAFALRMAIALALVLGADRHCA